MNLIDTDTYPFEDEHGERWLPVLARVVQRDWSAVVLDDEQQEYGFVVTWTDGINVWTERYEFVGVALARFAALVQAVTSNVFLVHDTYDPAALREFENEANGFFTRTVHASSCQAGCDGTDPMNHGGYP